jgi:hypothetical protein
MGVLPQPSGKAVVSASVRGVVEEASSSFLKKKNQKTFPRLRRA